MGLFHKREQIKIQLDEISFILYQIMLYNRDSPQSPTKKQKGIKRLQTVQFRRLQFSRLQAFKLLQTSQHNIDTKPLNLDYKSNEILLSSDAKLKHFLIPYYMRLKIKDVNKISYKESTAVMNASLIINIETTGLPQRFIKRMRSKLVLQINRCQQLKLKESNQIEINNQQYKNGQKTQLKITIRKQFTVHISKQYSKIFFSPFQQLVVIACFTLNSIYFYQNTLKVSFNSMQFMNINLDDKNIITNIEQDNHILAELLREIQYQYISKEKSMQIMNNKQKQKELINKRKRLLIDRFLRNKDDRQSLQIYFKEVRLELEKDVTSGDFQISKRLFGIHDSKLNYITQEQWKNNKNDSKQQIKNSLKKQSSLEKDVKEFREDGKDDHKKQEFKKFQYTHFYFTLYSDPFPGIFTILIPNIFLGMISLVVFIFKLSLIERTSIIATLLLGFIQLLPSMKEQIIDKSSLSLVQIITYIYTFMCFVSLFDSFNLHQNLLGNIAYYDQINLSAKLQTGFRLDQLLPENKYFVLSVAVNVALLVFIFSSILIFKIYENKYLIQPKNYRKSKDSKQSFFINIIGFVWRLIKYGIAYFKGKRLLNEGKNEQQNKKYLKYSDHQILSKFLKIPSKFSVKWSFFWCNKQCDLQLQKYNNSNKGNNKDYRPISHYDLSSIA